MKIIFYYDQRSLNVATLYYIKIIEKASLSIGMEMYYCTKLNNVSKGDILFTITEKYFCTAKLRYPFHKTIYWSQGIGPEEYLVTGNNIMKYWIKTIIEFISVKYSDVLFAVSNRMIENFEKKYRYNKTNYIVMPCYNLNYISGLSISTKERYNQPSFVYAGNFAAWQCVEETLQIFKHIQESIPNASLTLLVKEKIEAVTLIMKYELKDVTIEYVSLEDLQNELTKYKYGFIIREDTLVNNVATPTKMNSYLASAIIPIYTDAVDSFVENITLGEYTLCLKSKSSNDEKVQAILEFEEKIIVPNEFNEKIKLVFDCYYNDELYEKQIKEILKTTFKI
jgi:hypothetical protein